MIHVKPPPPAEPSFEADFVPANEDPPLTKQLDQPSERQWNLRVRLRKVRKSLHG